MKILITGVGGFVGTHLCKKFVQEKYKVLGVVRNFCSYSNFNYSGLDKKIDITEIDLARNADCLNGSISLYQPDVILHVAAQAIVKRSQENPVETIYSNVIGTTNLLEANRLYNKNLKIFLQFSTDKVYGNRDNAEEDYTYKPTCPYSASKIASEIICKSYAETYKLPIVITRSCNIYGPADYNRRVIPNVIEEILEKGTATIFDGDESMFRQYIYIEDLVSAISFILDVYLSTKRKEELGKQKISPIFNIAGSYVENVATTEQVVKMLADYGKAKIKRVPRTGNVVEITTQSLDSSKLQKLGWKSKYNLEDGLRKTFDWYKEHKDYFDLIRKR